MKGNKNKYAPFPTISKLEKQMSIAQFPCHVSKTNIMAAYPIKTLIFNIPKDFISGHVWSVTKFWFPWQPLKFMNRPFLLTFRSYSMPMVRVFSSSHKKEKEKEKKLTVLVSFN